MNTPLSEQETLAIRHTVEILSEHPGDLTRRFYVRFFERYPTTRELFGMYSHADQSRMLHETLVAALDHLDDARWLESTMQALGNRHRSYEVSDEMYDWFSECLLETFAHLLGPDFTPEHDAAWRKVLTRLCALMRHPGSP